MKSERYYANRGWREYVLCETGITRFKCAYDRAKAILAFIDSAPAFVSEDTKASLRASAMRGIQYQEQKRERQRAKDFSQFYGL